jgi:hypothetical protein
MHRFSLYRLPGQMKFDLLIDIGKDLDCLERVLKSARVDLR